MNVYGETAEGCDGDGDDVETERDAVAAVAFSKKNTYSGMALQVNSEKGVGRAN